MKQIKLNAMQNAKLTQALKKQQAYEEQFLTAQSMFFDAQKSKMDILEMIYDAHGIDASKYCQKNINYKDGVLMLTELKTGKASQDIKKALNTSNQSKKK